MVGKLKITINGVPIHSFAEDLCLINVKTHAFSDLICPDNTEEGFTVTPEATTIIVSVVSGLAVVVNSLLVYLANQQIGYVRIIDSSGRTLEFPKGTPPEEINLYKHILDNMDIERIVVSNIIADKSETNQ